jgi:hypothetical protein
MALVAEVHDGQVGIPYRRGTRRLQATKPDEAVIESCP